MAHRIDRPDRRLMLGAMGAGAGALLPWEAARAQVTDKGVLTIAYPVDVRPL